MFNSFPFLHLLKMKSFICVKMPFIFLILPLPFSLNLTLIISEMTIIYQNEGTAHSPIIAEKKITNFLHLIWLLDIKWTNAWRKCPLEWENCFCQTKTIITKETYIKFWIHTILLDARGIIRPTEHTGAIWVLPSWKEKPREQGHHDLPRSKSPRFCH